MLFLDKINTPGEIGKLNNEELYSLADEIRRFLIDNVSSTGGHLASNLGVVELTLALHKVFDFSKDRIIFDVGHQSYVHKILTGRKDEFSTLRKFGGLSGFPKVSESIYDAFDTGHASNSLSVAVGMKRAYLKNGDERNVIAFIGDGSFGGGMVYEAINDVGHTDKDNVIVVLNDNEMSISKNQSSIGYYLKKLRTSSRYLTAKKSVEKKLSSKPKLTGMIRNTKNKFKRLLIGNTFFDELGFSYYGPYDGHDIKELVRVFTNIKKIKKPVIIHVKTVKGKGYEFAEKNPEKFHGISNFDITTGANSKSSDYSEAAGKAIVNAAKNNEKVVAVTAAMPLGTGLSLFAETFPERFYDVGICEQHAVSMCGGMAAAGLIPVFAVYSSFLQRAYDQLMEDVALMNLHVVFCVDRAGIVGSDGETHQGAYDLSYLRTIPGFTVMAPSSFDELAKMLDFAINKMDSPVAIRYPRGNNQFERENVPEIEYAKAQTVREGDGITVLSCGSMLKTANEVCDILGSSGIRCELINIRFVKPLDDECIMTSANKTGRVVVMEDNSVSGGLGEAVARLLSGKNIRFFEAGIPDCFVKHGSPEEIYKMLEMDSDSVARKIKKEFGIK